MWWRSGEGDGIEEGDNGGGSVGKQIGWGRMCGCLSHHRQGLQPPWSTAPLGGLLVAAAVATQDLPGSHGGPRASPSECLPLSGVQRLSDNLEFISIGSFSHEGSPWLLSYQLDSPVTTGQHPRKCQITAVTHFFLFKSFVPHYLLLKLFNWRPLLQKCKLKDMQMFIRDVCILKPK